MKNTAREEHERRLLIMADELKRNYGARILPKFSWEEDGLIEFKQEEDAVAFKLRWS